MKDVYKISFGLWHGGFRDELVTEKTFIIDTRQVNEFVFYLGDEHGLCKEWWYANERLLDMTKKIGWQPSTYPVHTNKYLVKIEPIHIIDLWNKMLEGEF